MRIDPQNNYCQIKEIFRHYNRLNVTVSQCTREEKEKYSVCKEINKFNYDLGRKSLTRLNLLTRKLKIDWNGF